MRTEDCGLTRWAALGALLLAVAAGTLTAGCGDDDGGSGAPLPADSRSQPPEQSATGSVASTVILKDIAFLPGELSVAAGTAVRWANEDSTLHTVTSGTPPASDIEMPKADGAFEGSLDSAGAEFVHTFERTGTFSYFCSRHPATMHGTVVVQ